MKHPKFSFAVFFAALSFLMVCGCVKDPNYNVEKLEDIDESMNLFSQGLEFPLGHTDTISVGDLLEMEGMEGLDSIVRKDSKGDLSLGADGSYNLDGVIADMHLEKLKDINGSSFSTDVDYKIGDVNPDQFRIQGKDISQQSEAFSDFNLDDIPVPEISPADQKISTGMYKYLPTDMDLGKKVGSMKYTADLLSISRLSEKIVVSGNDEIPVQTFLDQIIGSGGASVSYQHKVDETISFGENASQIASVDNFTLKSGGTLKVDLIILNCPLTKGTLTPDVDLDISSMLGLSDAVGGKLDLSSMEMTQNNGWQSSRSYVVSSLASKFPEYDTGKLVLKGQMNLDGKVVISGAVSTPNTVKGMSEKTMQLQAVVSLDGVVLSEMDITLGEVSYKVEPDMEVPFNVQYTLPDAISSVKKIYFKDDRKLSVEISANGLSKLQTIDKTGHISVKPDVEITFPEGLEVQGAVDGKVVISGKDLYDGAITETFTLVSLTPTVSGKSLSYNGTVKAVIKAVSSGSFSSKGLPTGAAEDVTVTAKINCSPVLKDYDVVLDKENVTKTISQSQEFSFELDGLDDFGTFRIGLKNNPKATIEFGVPTTSEVNIVAEKLVVTIPQMMVVDGSLVEGFDPVNNTITLNGNLAGKIELPIQYLRVTPQKDQSGKTVVKGTFAINGAVSVSPIEITRKTFDELGGKKISFSASIPSMEASCITLEGDFKKSISSKQTDIVFLSEDDLSALPKEVKGIGELDFEDVNAIIELRFDGLPNSDNGYVLRDAAIVLPDFLYGENDSHTISLDRDIYLENATVIRQKAVISKIKDVKLEGVKEIKGDVSFDAVLYSEKPSVDVSTIQSTIHVNIAVGVGNGTEAQHPGKIAISKAMVYACYQLEQNESISLGNMPAELQDESVNLALNPVMRLQLTTNFGVPVKGDFVLTPYIKGEALDAVTIPGIELPCSDDSDKTLTSNYLIGAGVQAEPDEILIATDLSPLVRRVPDSISVAIKVNVDQTKTSVIYPDAKYICDMKYDLSVPLNFSKDFTLKLSTDVDVSEDVGKYIRQTPGKLKLSGTYLTTLPLGVEAVITLLDAEDRPIELTETAKLTIKPSPDGWRTSSEDFAIVLSIKDVMSADVRKIRFDLSASASDGVNLNESNFVKLNDLVLQLPGGIVINAQEE